MTREQAKLEIPRIERDGGAMPVMGLGTWQLNGEGCREAVRIALQQGYRHVDTARMYDNEEAVGHMVKFSGIPREEVWLTTKLQMAQLDGAGVRESCEASLRCLDQEYVDLLLIHWPEPDMDLAETFGAMEALRSAGKIRHVGVSNFTLDALQAAEKASDIAIFCNQIEFHPYIGQAPVIDWCRERDIAITAYCPLARGRAAADERLAEIGRKYGKTAAQVALRWLMEQPGVAAIPKGSSEPHLQENLHVFDFQLDPEDLSRIAGFEHHRRLIDPEWAPEWDS